MSPGHPFVMCHYGHYPHGRTFGVASLDEFREIERARRKAIAMKRHRAHIAAGRVGSCPICQALPLTPTV
jgi:hypothetical protein